MKETIVKINKNKTWFFEENRQAFCRLIKKKKRRIKSIKLERKKRLQQCRNTRDYKRLL